MEGLVHKFQKTSYFSDAQHVFNVEEGDVVDRGRYDAARVSVLDWQQRKADIKLIGAGLLASGAILSKRPWLRTVGLVVAGLLAKNAVKHDRNVFEARQDKSLPLTQVFDI